MEYSTFSGLYTLFLIFIFIGIFIWAFNKKRKKSFDEAANIIFSDDDKKLSSASTKQGTKK